MTSIAERIAGLQHELCTLQVREAQVRYELQALLLPVRVKEPVQKTYGKRTVLREALQDHALTIKDAHMVLKMHGFKPVTDTYLHQLMAQVKHTHGNISRTRNAQGEIVWTVKPESVRRVA